MGTTLRKDNYRTYEDYCLERDKYLKLYNQMLDNRELSLDRFLTNIGNSLGTDFDKLSKISSYLEKNKTLFSITKTDIMFKIINYIQGNNGKQEKEELDNLIKKSNIKMEMTGSVKRVQEHKECMKKMISEVNTVISDKRDYKELLTDGVITDEFLYSKANKNICELDNETFLNFVIKYKNISKISISELLKYKEVLEYFIRYLQKNLILLTNFNDEKLIRNLYVSGEEDLNPITKSSAHRLKKWKVSKISKLLEYYTQTYENVTTIINTKSIEGIKNIKFNYYIMGYEEDFVVDYHKNLHNILAMLTNIKKMKNITDDRNKVLCKMYNEKIIIENN